jgi:hypothetical protein
MGITPGGYSESQATPPISEYSQQIRLFVTDHWKIHSRLTVDVGMRFDHFTRPGTTDSLGMAVFYPSAYSNDPSQLNYHPGLFWHGKDPWIPVSGVKSRLFYYSPRLGMALDIFGTGKTVLRGGYGKFRAYDRVTGDNYDSSTALPWGAATISCDGSYCSTGCPTWPAVYQTLGQYIGHTLPGPLPPERLSISAINPFDDEQPLVTTYNAQIDQKLPGKFMLEMSYVGNYGEFFQYQQDINAIPVGTVPYATLFTCTQNNNCQSWDNTVRPMQNYLSVNTTQLAGKTQYDALQVSLHRNVGILSLMANYTWAKMYGNTVVGNGGMFSSLPDNGRSEYWGVSKDDRPQTLNLTYTVNLPRVQAGNRILHGVVNGWQISGITSINSGVNLIAAGGNNLNYGWSDAWTVNPANGQNQTLVTMHSAMAYTGADNLTLYPTVVCNPMIHGGQEATTSYGVPGRRYLNTNCFAPTTSGLGSSHLPYLGGPIYWASDLGVSKNIKIREGQSVNFKFQGFDFLNHSLWSFGSSDPNLYLPYGQTHDPTTGAIVKDGVLLNPDFGIATKRYGHRSLQLEARYTF